MCSFRTSRLTIRRFSPEDWPELLEIARSKESSPYAYTDFTWPTTEEWAKESAAYMSTDSDMWAIALRENNRVICFVNFNGLNDAGYMDVGHVMNLTYAGQGYETEGLAALYQHIFDTTNAIGITAAWALDDKEKIAPLLSLGMKIVSQDTTDAFDGSGRKFTHCILQLSREEWPVLL